LVPSQTENTIKPPLLVAAGPFTAERQRSSVLGAVEPICPLEIASMPQRQNSTPIHVLKLIKTVRKLAPTSANFFGVDALEWNNTFQAMLFTALQN
jgi:hypothetical protein